MLKKLKLGSSLVALILFSLPWLDIQCSEKSLATQTGFQVVYGDATAVEQNMDMGTGTNEKKSSDDSLGFAPLVALALIAVIGSVIFSFTALFKGGAQADKLSSVLPAVALVLLLLQLMIGFPAKNKIIESMRESTVKSGQMNDDPFADLGSSMVAAIVSSIRIKKTPVFYFELLALGIPTLLLLNGLIDKYKKDNT